MLRARATRRHDTAETAAPRPAAVRAATTATYIAFAGCGVLLSSCAPAFRRSGTTSASTPGQLGAILLAGAAGALSPGRSPDGW
ncbi:hypothetical protein GCM10018954_082200 [Kutzneria kofuensis]